MGVEILISNINKPARNQLRRGAPIAAKDTPAVWGDKEGPPTFIRVACDTLTKAQVDTYLAQWVLDIEYSVEEHNPSTDYYRISAAAQQTATTDDWGVDYGNLTRGKIEGYLNAWSLTVLSVTPNHVEFEGTIYGVIQSNQFWDHDVSGVVFNETDYDTTTGIHTVTANYSAKSWPANKVEGFVAMRGGSVVTHDEGQKIISFTIDRDSVREGFKRDVAEKVRELLYISRYYFTESVMDWAVSQGGIVTVTQTQLLSNMTDRLA